MSNHRPPLLLYIEDDEDSQRLVSRILTPDFTVITAVDPLTGHKLAIQQKPDIILMDINLPHLAGHKLTSSLRTETLVPIIALTAEGSRAEEYLLAGCTGCIEKPITDANGFRQTILDYFTSYHRSGQAPTQKSYTRYIYDLAASLHEAVASHLQTNDILTRDGMAREKFASVLGHELRTPVALLVGSYELMKLYPPDTPQYLRAFEAMGKTITHLKALVERLNIIAFLTADPSSALSPDHYKLKSVDVYDLLQTIKEEFDELLTQHNRIIELSLSKHPEGTTCSVQAECAMFRIAVEELLSNAIKYTPDGGQVVIELTAAGLTIKDTGTGIPTAEIPHLLQPFTSAADTYTHHTTSKIAYLGGGLGIGLTVAHRIIEMHQWRLQIESEEGTGTKVIITFGPASETVIHEDIP